MNTIQNGKACKISLPKFVLVEMWKRLLCKADSRILFLLSLLAGGGLSLYCGLDSNYDLKKYHLHNAWAFMEGRMEMDLFPAGLQTYYSPLLDLPYYWMSVEWFPNAPHLVAFLMGIPTGILIFLTFVCIYQLLKTLPNLGEFERRLFTALLAFFGLSGTSMVIQIGSVTNEVQSACFVTGALASFLLLRKRLILAAVVAGALLGTGVGFKLTAVVYTPAFLLAFVFFAERWKQRAWIFLCFSFTWWFLFFAVYGWWGWTLYRLTGNPIFPMYNNIFQSDWLPPMALPGSWFLPQTWKESLFFPFFWVNSRTASASAGTDLRFAIAYVSGLILFFFRIFNWCSLRRGREKDNIPKSYAIPSAAKFLLTFLLLGFIFWELFFSALRYSIPMEVLLGIVPFVCIWSILDALKVCAQRQRILCLAAICVPLAFIAGGTTKYPWWGRLRSPQSAVFSMPVPNLQENSLVFLYAPETQFLAPFIAKKNPTATFTSPGDDPLFLPVAMRNSVLHRKVLARVREHNGPVAVLSHPSDADFPKHLSEFGLSVAECPYVPIQTNHGEFRLYFAMKDEALDAATARAKSESMKAFFVENTLHLTPLIKSAKEEYSLFEGNRVNRISGWSSKNLSGHLDSTAKKCVIEFFLTGAEAREFRRMEIRGKIFANQGFSVELNGAGLCEVRKGEIPPVSYASATEEKKGVPVQDIFRTSPISFSSSVSKFRLRDASEGPNVLVFTFLDARAFDDLPWPLVRRPRSGNLPPRAFELHDISFSAESENNGSSLPSGGLGIE